jgi:hypothetical protein
LHYKTLPKQGYKTWGVTAGAGVLLGEVMVILLGMGARFYWKRVCSKNKIKEKRNSHMK